MPARRKAAEPVRSVKRTDKPAKPAGKPRKELEELYLKKIKGSRLSAEQGRKLGFKVCTVEECPLWLPVEAGGFVIPYWGFDGRPTEFIRYRYLEAPPRSGFAGLTQQKKELRYGQVTGSVNELYLPPLIDWKKVAGDSSTTIAITEGELKAACASIHTPVPTIGLGGVWCWKSNRKRAPMLPAFDEFVWTDRVVYIIFDSDAATNPLVVQAENALARALCDRGAIPIVIRLPPTEEGGKVGLDDYLYSHTAEDYAELLKAGEEWARAAELHKLNEEVVYVQDPGFVVRLDTLQKMAPHAFVGHHYATRIFWEEQEVAGKDGNLRIKLVKKAAAQEWVRWPGRSEAWKMTYEPGGERITENGSLNVWPGWAVEPAPGDVSLWAQLLDHLFEGMPEERTWFERWLAYPLQHPGTKLFTYVLMWSGKHGTGKSFIGYTMKQIYGKNWTEIKNKDLEGSHNGWAENRQFCMGDEVAIGDKRGLGDSVKGMITQEDCTINIKYVPTYTVPDVINYYFTSNHADSFFLEDEDRRAFVHEVRSDALPDEFWQRYERWIKRDKYPDAPGPSALFHHLLTLDLGDFNPKAKAPLTAAKRDMVATNRSELADWVARLKENPDEVLKNGNAVVPHALWRAEVLLQLFDPEQRTKVSSMGMARELRRQGFQKAGFGMGCPTRTDGQLRLWVIRPVTDKHVMENQMAAAKYYDNERAGTPAKRSKVK